MTIDTGWHPVALAAGFDAGTSAGTRLFGFELVVWRDDAGMSHVWEDRCPHRGMRLSFGFVRGSHIACLYHGWQFDAAGQCRFIPAHPRLDVPHTIRVTRYAAAERLGMVWVRHGSETAAKSPPGDDGPTTAVRSITIVASADAVMEAIRSVPSPFSSKPFDVARDGALLWLPAGQRTVVIGLQALAAGETGLHISLLGKASGERHDISDWSQAVRRAAEALAPPALPA